MPKLPFLLAAALCVAACSPIVMINNLTPRTGRLYSDIPFAEDVGLALDVYSPRGAEAAPVVIFFYPGRWRFGDKAEYRYVADGLQSHGFVAVIANYRLYPSVKFPSFIEDSARAVKWTHDNIASYGGDPDKVFVMGHSSGAYNAAMLALDESYLHAVGGSRAWLRGMIGLSGPYDFPIDAAPELPGIFGEVEVYANSQPVHFVDGKNPPLLLLHGENDDAVNVSNTRSLGRKVFDAGGRVETVIYDDLNHGFIVASLSPTVKFRQSPLEMIAAFVRKYAGDAPPSVPAS